MEVLAGTTDSTRHPHVGQYSPIFSPLMTWVVGSSTPNGFLHHRKCIIRAYTQWAIVVISNKLIGSFRIALSKHCKQNHKTCMHAITFEALFALLLSSISESGGISEIISGAWLARSFIPSTVKVTRVTFQGRNCSSHTFVWIAKPPIKM